MPATVHLNMIKEKHKTMINGFTFKSWPLISNVLLVLTGNYISISISLPLYQWTMAYLKPPIPLPHPLLLVDDLIHPSQLQKFAEKNTNHPKRTPSIFPHIVHLLSWYFGCAVRALSSHQCLYLCRGCQSLLSAQRHCNYPLFFLNHDFLFSVRSFLSTT